MSPIVFNLDEVFALYFSMLTLRDYESTPFHLSVENLKQKFENCLAPEKIEMLRKTEKVFRLGTVPQNNHCGFLKDILKSAIEERVCDVHYGNGKYQPKPFTDFTRSADALYKSTTATDFEVMVSSKGIDLFQKEHYPSMRLNFENGQYYIRGFYNQGEENFISSYFLGYGKNLLSVQPVELLKLILEKLDNLQLHVQSL